MEFVWVTIFYVNPKHFHNVCHAASEIYAKPNLQESRKLFAQGPMRVTLFYSFSQKGTGTFLDGSVLGIYIPIQVVELFLSSFWGRGLFLGSHSQCFRHIDVRNMQSLLLQGYSHGWEVWGKGKLLVGLWYGVKYLPWRLRAVSGPSMLE